MQLKNFAKLYDAPPLEKALHDVVSVMPILASKESVACVAALGRFLAQTLVAPVSLPSCDLAMVDGYAVAIDDVNPKAETKLPVSAKIPSGMHFFLPQHLRGSAAHVFEGSPIPQGADSVFTSADTMRDGDFVTLPHGQAGGRNIRKAGRDFASGEIVLRNGTRLCPHHLSTCAALGLSQIEVFAPLRVAVFSTGHNLLDARHYKEPLLVGAQFDSTRVMLVSLLNARGITVLDLGILPNDRERIIPALELAATGCDVILCSGNISAEAGEGFPPGLREASEISFCALAMHPGGPLAMGQVGGRPFFGLPETPLAAYVALTRFVGPILDTLSGGQARLLKGFSLTAAFSYAKAEGRRDYLPVTRYQRRDGGFELRLCLKSGDEMLSTLNMADGFAEIPEHVTQILAGQNVQFLPFSLLASGEHVAG